MSVNKAILIGRLGKDPDIRYMPNGEAVTNFSLATSENWKDKAGEKQEKTDWHNCVAYRRLAEVVGEYCKKGALIYVEGKITTEKWTDKEGHDRYTTKIICHEMQMLGSKQDGGSQEYPGRPGGAPDKPAKPAAKPGSLDNFDDDIIPF